MYAVLGDIEFELLVYWDGFDATFGMDYAEHARIEGKPGLQFIGEKLNEISISLIFNNHYCQPDVELARLHDAMVAHQALALVFGNGDYRGWFVITDIRATSQQTDGLGNVQSSSAELTLREYIGDPKNPLTPPAVSGDDPNIDSWSDDADDDFPGSDLFEGLSDITEGLNEVAGALDDAEQAFDEVIDWVENNVEQVQSAIDDILRQLEEALDKVLQPLERIMQTLERIIKSADRLVETLAVVGQVATQIYDEISSVKARLEGVTSHFGDLFVQARDVVRHSQSLMEESSKSVSRLAAIMITRSV